MKADRERKMVRSELLEAITVFMAVGSFFLLVVFDSRRLPRAIRGREAPIKALPLSASDRSRASVLREWRARKKILR
jgi:hypothetical protein